VLSSFDKLGVVAVESSGCAAAGLVRYLRSQGLRVLEVNQPHAHRRRRLATAIRSMPSRRAAGASPAR
jgi:hypothetical protein